MAGVVLPVDVVAMNFLPFGNLVFSLFSFFDFRLFYFLAQSSFFGLRARELIVNNAGAHWVIR